MFQQIYIVTSMGMATLTCKQVFALFKNDFFSNSPRLR